MNLLDCLKGILPTANPAPEIHPIPLSQDDEGHLTTYEGKLQLVRDYTRGVALGYSSGFFLYGVGGISKSFTVLGELERLKVSYKLFNSRMSGRGLFDTLAAYSDSVHVLEDMERIVNDRDSQGVLRSATWSQRNREGRQSRVVTWATGKGVESLVFSGGIIMMSNRPLDDLPELRAIRTRISHLHLTVSDNEIGALMRQVAAGGFLHGKVAMTSEECTQICEFIIAESKNRQCRLDMRLLDNSFRDYLQWREGSSTSDWQTLVTTRLQGREGELASGSRREEELEEDLNCMEEVLREFPTITAAQEEWCRSRGKSRATFFRCRGAYLKSMVPA